jgi:hypothetical protein
MTRPVETLLRDLFLGKQYEPASGDYLLENETPALPPSPLLAPRPYAPLLVPIILAAVLNVIIPSVMGAAGPGNERARIAAFFLAGIVVGQFALLATWAVLGPWQLYVQWFAALLSWLGLFMALILGAAITGDLPRHWNELLQATLGYSAAFVAAQAPLWCIRLLRGWRLVLRGADAARTAIQSRQLEIRDILIATTILALFLGTMNIVAKGSDTFAPGDVPFIVFGLCGIAVVWSALVLPFCLWVCFGASAIRVRIAALMGYLITLAAIAMGVAAAVSGGWAFVGEPQIGFFLLLNVALLATVLSGLGLARACGYVLVSVRSARHRRAPVDDNQGAA